MKLAAQIWINRYVTDLWTPGSYWGKIMEDVDRDNQGKWIAVGQHGNMFYSISPDASEWNKVISPFGDVSIQQVKYIKEFGLWIVTGERGQYSNTGRICTSPDGVNWTFQTNDFGSSSTSGIAFGNGIGVVTGENGKIAVSTDCVNWSMIPSEGNPFSLDHTIYMIDFSPVHNIFVAVSDLGQLATSKDGINWILRNSTFGSNDIYCVRWCGDRFIAGGTNGSMATSEYGINWAQWSGRVKTQWGSNFICDIAGEEGLYIMVGGGLTGPAYLVISLDAVNWGFVHDNYPYAIFGNGSGFISGIRYKNGVCVAVGWDGTNPAVATSAYYN